jgi:pyruvate-formate lyase-activating enzyme
VSLSPSAGEKYHLKRQFQWPPPYSCIGTRITPRRVQNLIQSNLERRSGELQLGSYPAKLTLEATSACNLRCPACFTGKGEVGRPPGAFPLEAFRRLIAELGPFLFEVEFYKWGEPLLAPQLADMIELTHAAGVSTSVSTNFSFGFDDAHIERLVSSGLTVLGVSIDGATQETYEQYRVGGNLALVLDNCRRLAAIKQRLGSETPRLVWVFHVFPHNVAEVDQARGMAAEIAMDIFVDKGFLIGPDWDPEGRFQFSWQPPHYPERCDFLWGHAAVNNDGGVSPCAGTFYREDDVGKLGTADDDGGAGSFREIWNGERLQRSRDLFHARNGPDAARELICHGCPRTVLWEEWQRELSSGKPQGTFRPTVTADLAEWVNFLWQRRQTTSPEQRRLVPLRRKPMADQS